MNLLLPALVVGALFLTGKNLKEQLERVTVTGFRIQDGSVKLNEVLLKVTLDIYNPNSQALKFGYFQGYISRNGIRLGRFDFNDDGKNTKFPGRATTPATFNIRITTVGIVSNLLNIFKNLKNSKPIDTTFSVDGIMNVGGLDLPIKYSYDIKNAISGVGGDEYQHDTKNQRYRKIIPGKNWYSKITYGPWMPYKKAKRESNELFADKWNVAVEGIGKPYAKFEFSSNDEMQSYLRKNCPDHKFSLNG